MYKQASRAGLRFTTNRGVLTVEQVWSLSLTDLSAAIKAAKKLLKVSDSDDELSFLGETTPVDQENQLKFDILKDIYLTKKKESEEKQIAAEIKAHNKRIDELIARKQEEALESKSIDELEKMRK